MPRPSSIVGHPRQGERQRRSGPAAIRAPLLNLVMDYSRTLNDETIGRKLDVPPAMLAKWRKLKTDEIRQSILADPMEDATQQLATFEALERACHRVLNSPNASAGALTAAIDRLLRIDRQRHERKEALGLVRRSDLPAPKDRAMTLADMLRAAAADFMLGSPSVREDMDFDQAVAALMGDLAAADEA
jgi:hypothetical protein